MTGVAALPRPILVEGYADLLPLPPDDVTRNVRAVRLKDEIETLRNLKRVGDVRAPLPKWKCRGLSSSRCR